MALLSLEAGHENQSQWARLARTLSFEVDLKSGAILVKGEDLGDRLRGEQVSAMASRISQYSSVRKVLTARQRVLGNKLARRLPVVVEGRDIGTVVFPKSRFKFFVTAAPKVRADRRYRQLKSKGVRGISLSSILKEINRRDRQDSTRKVAPLRCPEDAVVVDTSKMPIPQVVLFLKHHIDSKLTNY